MQSQNLNLLSIGQASEYLGISIDTLRRWEKKGKITSYRSPGGHRYFKKNELDEMFGRKYERAEETKPRKDYETAQKPQDNQDVVTTTEPIQISQITPINQIETIETDFEETQNIVDQISSEETKIEEEIKSFFGRQPKNIEIPRIEPVKIKLVEENKTETISAPTPYQSTVPTSTAAPKLFTSFSQIPDGRSPAITKPTIKLNIQYFLIIVASVVIIVAIVFGVIYFLNQPKMVSPI